MSESSASSNACPKCGAALPSSATAGLCPRCLMAEAMVPTQAEAEPAAASRALAPEELASHFPQLEILEYLGRGGMGVVYKARQKSLNRLVALKLLAPERVGDAQFAERFTREAQALAALNHPNIVTIYDFGQAGGFYYLLMEFVDGLNLRQLLRTRRFTPEEALAIVPPLCDALQFAHDQGIVHRDIKPENLLLDKAGRVKVADFGIARMLGAANGGGATGTTGVPQSLTQSTLGTPAYSAPEQKADPQRADSRADIYSLGVVFYELLTGELPGKPLQPPSRKVQIDVRLDEVVLHALEKEPERRYQQASQVKTAIEQITVGPTKAVKQPQSVGRVWKIAGAVMAAVVVVSLVIVVIALRPTLSKPRPAIEMITLGGFKPAPGTGDVGNEQVGAILDMTLVNVTPAPTSAQPATAALDMTLVNFTPGPTSTQPATAVSNVQVSTVPHPPDTTDLGMLELRDGIAARFDLGGGTNCVLMPTTLSDGNVTMVVTVSATNADGAVLELGRSRISARPGQHCSISVGDRMIALAVKLKTQ